MADRRQKLVDLVVDRYVNLELFNEKQQPQANGCINWTGVQSNIGYGFIGFRRIDPITGGPMSGSKSTSGGMMTTHRLAFMVANKRMPNERNVNHTCHNKLCVNPTHLVEGTQREKLDAMIAAGIKGGSPKGVKRGSYNRKQNRKYKYTEEHIQWMRITTTTEIAAKLGITIIKASRKQWGFRQGYTWLPCPPYEKQKRGRKPKQ